MPAENAKKVMFKSFGNIPAGNLTLICGKNYPQQDKKATRIESPFYFCLFTYSAIAAALSEIVRSALCSLELFNTADVAVYFGVEPSGARRGSARVPNDIRSV
jgi:hypothetical protein